MRKHGPPSVIVIRKNASSESKSVYDSPRTGILSRGRQWLKGSLPGGKTKLANGSVNLRHSSRTEDTELIEYLKELDLQRPESPQGETSEESAEPMETMFEPLHTKLTVERIDESPLEEVECSEELYRIQETLEASSRKTKDSRKGRKTVVTRKSELDIPDLSSKPKLWKSIERKVLGSKEDQRWSSIDNEKEYKRVKAKRGQTDPELSCRMQRRNAIVLYGDDCKAIRKLLQKDPGERNDSTKQKRKQARRRSSRSSTSSRSSSIVVRNFVGAESLDASIPKTIQTKIPTKVDRKMKISFGSVLIFLSGIITTVLVMHMSAIVDEWLKSQMPEDMDWSRVFDDWVASLVQEDGTQSFIELISE